MSHTTKLKGVPLTSVSAIRTAVEALQAQGVKCELKENVAPRMYGDYGGQFPHGTSKNVVNRGQQFRKDVKGVTGRKVDVAEYCIELTEGKYDVGLVHNPDTGEYDPVYDAWKGHVGSVLGVPERAGGSLNGAQGDLAKFYQQYSIAQATEWAAEQGYQVEATCDEANGEIHMHIVGM